MSLGPERLRIFAPAKINLSLHVGNRRADGYHDLQSAVVFAESGDVLVLEQASGLSLSLNGPFADILVRETDNLVLKAARLFAAHEKSPLGANLALTKNLPVASGIGGGSADAAAALRGLAALWGRPDASPDISMDLAAQIGSDVPVCLLSRPAWMEGRGERVAFLGEVPPLDLVLVNPRVAVPTAEVFRRLEKRSGTGRSMPADLGSLRAVKDYVAASTNDLEAPALATAPQIGDVLTLLRAHDAVAARMSGSGATCFGVFETPHAAVAVAGAIAKARPDWWVVATRIASSEIGKPHREGQ